MSYPELVQFYFGRSDALQWYWTIYVIVIGGLLAFSSLRKQPDRRSTLLVTLLYCFFAYKNLGAIYDVSLQRFAILDTIRQMPLPDNVPAHQFRSRIEPTLNPPDYPGVKRFHVTSDVLTVAAVWAMELRRKRNRDYDEQHARSAA